MMQSLLSLPHFLFEMNKADHRHYRTLTPHSLYMCIRAVLELVNTPNADIVLSVDIATMNMNTALDTSVVDFPLNEPPILLPLPPTQSNLPQ